LLEGLDQDFAHTAHRQHDVSAAEQRLFRGNRCFDQLPYALLEVIRLFHPSPHFKSVLFSSRFVNSLDEKSGPVTTRAKSCSPPPVRPVSQPRVALWRAASEPRIQVFPEGDRESYVLPVQDGKRDHLE
jgi:hypothetical protein